MSQLKSQIQAFINEDIDYLVLGCTHYPYIIPQLKSLLPNNVHIIDSGRAVAAQTLTVLKNNNLLTTSKTKGSVTIFTNVDNIKLLQSLTKSLDLVNIQQKVF
jgi:glutamate racemase